MPIPISAEPEITACSVSPAPCVPKVSSAIPCFWKMPAFKPRVGAWLAQASIWPIATFTASAARVGDGIAALATMNAIRHDPMRIGMLTSKLSSRPQASRLA
jgi:hypothetical protein